MFVLTAQTSTNRAQTNDTGLERFEGHGVESDVTQPKKECSISQTRNQHKRWFLRHKSAQTQHKRIWHSFGNDFDLWGANFTEVQDLQVFHGLDQMVVVNLGLIIGWVLTI